MDTAGGALPLPAVILHVHACAWLPYSPIWWKG